MNSVTLIGRIGNDLELKEGKISYTKFRLAVDRPVRAGEEKQTDWIGIVVFGKQAETLCKYQKKGKQIAVAGYIQTGSYKNKNGDTVYTTDVIANRIEFLSGFEKSEKKEETQEAFDGFAELEGSVPF